MKTGASSATSCTISRSEPLWVAAPVPVFIAIGLAATVWVGGLGRSAGAQESPPPRLTVPSPATIRLDPGPQPTPAQRHDASPIGTAIAESAEKVEKPTTLVPLSPGAEQSPANSESGSATPLETNAQPPAATITLPNGEGKSAGDDALRPIANPSELGLAKLEAASFNGVTPGTTTAADLDKTWGQPKEIKKHDGMLTQRYAVEPFERIDVTLIDNKVTAVVIRFGQAFPVDSVAKQLELTDVRPVMVSNELGEILGQAYPERGVLFAFAPSEDGKPSMKVSQIILEPLSAEPFVLRAETYLETRTKASLLDLEEAIKLDPKNARAQWLYGRVLAVSGQRDKAAAALAQAVAASPDNAQYRVSRAEVLGQTGKLDDALAEAQKAAELAENRPHVRARALCLLGDLFASSAKHDYRQALQLHTEAVKIADALTGDKHPAIRQAAKEVMVDAHLGAAHDIAWGEWKDKEVSVSRWLERAAAAADDMITNENAGVDVRLRVCSRALASCVGLRGGIDPTVWTRAALHIGQNLIKDCNDPIRKAQLQWELGLALYDAMQAFQMRGDHAAALKYGEQTVKLLDVGQAPPTDSAAYLLGRVYYRLGAIHSLRHKDHKAAVAWFDRATPLLKRPLPAEAAADVGRHGETFVSMGVSYWEIGQRDTAVELTAYGVTLMEQAAKQGLLDSAALAIPYGNLSAMHQERGAADAAKRYQSMATRARSTTR